jgi:hypothetical protein
MNKILKLIQKTLEKNWKIIVAIVAGIILGGYFLGNISGISFYKNKLCFTFFIYHDMHLPKPVDITGKWVYEAIADSLFTEDHCQKRFGSVKIIAKANGYEINVLGHRIIEENCFCMNNDSIKRNQIIWKSDNAVVSVINREMFLWFHTTDPIPRYGHISAMIIPSDNDIRPEKMEGEMHYLENLNKTWLKAQINFYRLGTPEAENIIKKWQ